VRIRLLVTVVLHVLSRRAALDGEQRQV